jgi:hypothetical protein
MGKLLADEQKTDSENKTAPISLLIGISWKWTPLSCVWNDWVPNRRWLRTRWLELSRDRASLEMARNALLSC